MWSKLLAGWRITGTGSGGGEEEDKPPEKTSMAPPMPVVSKIVRAVIADRARAFAEPELDGGGPPTSVELGAARRCDAME